jgi:hypothetical protein
MDVRVIGQPMSFWQNMPAGLLRRSNWTATCIAEYEGELSLGCAGIRDLKEHRKSATCAIRWPKPICPGVQIFNGHHRLATGAVSRETVEST